MALTAYTCRCCGANIVPEEGAKSGICEYCGTEVVFPSAGINKMNRANELRRNRNFDQAEAVYRSLLSVYPEDSEIWWSILLCEYGVEYVEEAHRRVPTVNRMKFDSVLQSGSFQKVMEYADPAARPIYERDARQIEDIQARLQQIAVQEAKYDVFISFKDQDDETHERTYDSVIAQDVYERLTDEGYRVFFSRISLRTAVGQEFEPKIFAALHSARVMLVVATCERYVNADWVKNEWSRYLKLMETDPGKFLLPVYHGMGPELLPGKMKGMEGIDANELNYLNLISQNVASRLGKRKAEPQAVSAEMFGQLRSDELQRLMRHGYECLNSEDFDEADAAFDRALDVDAFYTPAWWGKFLAATQFLSPACDRRSDRKTMILYERALGCESEEQRQEYKRRYQGYCEDIQNRQYQDYVERLETMTDQYTRTYAGDARGWKEAQAQAKKALTWNCTADKTALRQIMEEYSQRVKQAAAAYEDRCRRTKEFEEAYRRLDRDCGQVVEDAKKEYKTWKPEFEKEWDKQEKIWPTKKHFIIVAVMLFGVYKIGFARFFEGVSVIFGGVRTGRWDDLLPFLMMLGIIALFTWALWRVVWGSWVYLGGKCSLNSRLERMSEEGKALMKKHYSQIDQKAAQMIATLDKYTDLLDGGIGRDYPERAAYWQDQMRTFYGEGKEK